MNKGRYEFYYGKIYDWFQNRQRQYLVLKFTYRCIPYLVACLYLGLLSYAFLFLTILDVEKLLVVPAVTFVSISILRKYVNRPRPYVQYQITPLIRKDKTGESFPSRHTLSVAIIAMAWMYADWRMGVMLWILTLLTATIRVLCGVHFVSDVLAAMLFAIFFGFVGFWLL